MAMAPNASPGHGVSALMVGPSQIVILPDHDNPSSLPPYHCEVCRLAIAVRLPSSNGSNQVTKVIGERSDFSRNGRVVPPPSVPPLLALLPSSSHSRHFHLCSARIPSLRSTLSDQTLSLRRRIESSLSGGTCSLSSSLTALSLSCSSLCLVHIQTRTLHST